MSASSFALTKSSIVSVQLTVLCVLIWAGFVVGEKYAALADAEVNIAALEVQVTRNQNDLIAVIERLEAIQSDVSDIKSILLSAY